MKEEEIVKFGSGPTQFNMVANDVSKQKKNVHIFLEILFETENQNLKEINLHRRNSPV